MQKDKLDVVSLPVELDGKIIDSQFRLVLAVIKRAKALHQGAIPSIATRAMKVTTTALEEVVSGSIHVLMGEAAIKAREEAEKRTHEILIDEAAQKVSFHEQLTELEKDLEEYLRQKEIEDS